MFAGGGPGGDGGATPPASDGGEIGANSGGNLFLAVDNFVQSSTGIIRLNGTNATGVRNGSGHGGGAAGTLYVICNDADIAGLVEADGGSGSERVNDDGSTIEDARGGDGAEGAIVILYANSVSRSGATLPTNIYEKQLSVGLPFGTAYVL